MTLNSVTDYERQAREAISPAAFPGLFSDRRHPVDQTNRNNVGAFADFVLRPRVLVDVSRRTLGTEALGQRISLPVMLAPASGHARFHPDGELASARAAGAAGTVFTLSTLSSYSIEEVAAKAEGPIWFQLYVLTDRHLVERLVQRAEKAGCSCLVITVDNKTFRFPGGTGPVGLDRPHGEFSNFVGFDPAQVPTADNWSERKSRSFNWSDLKWIRSITSMPIVLKGIQTVEDATLCAEYGVNGLIVSNHGGWALYGAKGTVSTLPEIAQVARGKLEIYLDGGIRRGTDILKALALGARAVFIGRAMIWGLACDGEAGVRDVLEILRGELDDAMGLSGVADAAHVDSGLVARRDELNHPDVVQQLERLVVLMDRGFLNREEFEIAKVRLLRA